MAGEITTGSFPKLLWPGVKDVWGMNYKEHAAEYTYIFEKYTSDKNYEEDVGVSGLGLMSVKSQAQAISYDSMQQMGVSRYVHITYGLGFIVTREEYEDNLYIKYGTQRTKALAKAAMQTKEITGANILNRAFNTSYTYWDGKPLIASDHPAYGGSSMSNLIGQAADLSEVSLEQLLIQIDKAVDYRGNKIVLKPKKLIIPAELRFDAQRIIGDPDRPGTADRDINAMYQLGSLPNGYAVNHYLTDPDAWFIITDVDDGLKYFERRATEFASDNDFDTENAKFKSTYRCSFGATDTAHCIFGSPGA